jgi:tetratricopeptide (TPR) repeat protein
VAAVLVALLTGFTSGVLYGLYEHQKAAERVREVEGSRTVQDLYVKGQQAEDSGLLVNAKEHYDQALATFDAVPGAAGEEMRRSLEDGIKRVGEHLKEQGRLAERRERFRNHYDQMQFRAVPFPLPGRDAADDAAAVRREAPVALEQFGLDASDPQRLARGLEPFRQLIGTPDQLNRLADECVEVLLAWADAEAVSPAPGGPNQALRLLDGAAALGRAHGLGTSRALHLRRAKCLELLGDYNSARAERKRAGGLALTTALDHFDAALTSYLAGSAAEAGAACAWVLRLRPDHFWAQYLQVLCYLKEKRWGEAEVLLNVCQGRRPDFVWLFPLLGIAHTGLKQYDAAETDFARALKLSSDLRDPAFRAMALTNRSAMRRLQGRQEDAERDLREAIALQPKVYQSYVTLADLLRGRGDRPGALQLLNEALARHPDNPVLYSQRARLHEDRGDREAARRDFEQVIDKEPLNSKSDRVLAARVELAHLRCLAGEKEAALADCDAVLAARPNFPEAHRQRAEALLALGRNQEAGAALDQYMKLSDKPTPEALRARGLLYAEQGDYRAAVAAYSQALHLKEDAETLRDRGWAYLAQDAVRPARDDFDAALRLNPKDGDALAGRGIVLVLRGRPADVAGATAAAEQSLRSGSPTSRRLMACVHIYTRAAGLLEAAPRRPADDPPAARYRLRALGLLHQAVELVPEKERATFWRERVLGDPVLKPLQRTSAWFQLDSTYGG